MKKLAKTIFSIFLVLNFISCDSEYDLGELASTDDARVIRASIDVRDVAWDDQRQHYDHANKVVTIEVLGNPDLSSITVYVSPTQWASMSPYGGVEEDWSSGEKEYTITSGDGSVTNVYTVKIVDVTSFSS